MLKIKIAADFRSGESSEQILSGSCKMACADHDGDLEDMETSLEVPTQTQASESCGVVQLQPRKASRKAATEDEVRQRMSRKLAWAHGARCRLQLLLKRVYPVLGGYL